MPNGEAPVGSTGWPSLGILSNFQVTLGSGGKQEEAEGVSWEKPGWLKRQCLHLLVE